MKNCYLGIFFLCSVGSVFGQVGIGTNTPDESAVLEVYSKDAGLLIPRMIQSARDGISNPAEGLLIYQTNNDKGFYYYDGSSWVPLGSVGRMITKMVATPLGEIEVYYTDGTSIAFPGFQGPMGDRGEAFTVKYSGLPSDRVAYKGLPKGEAFYDVVNGLLYFRTGLPSPKDWSMGIPFGKGIKGEEGVSGDQGLTGVRGLRGYKGDRGRRGLQGYPFEPSKTGLLKDRDKYITSTIPSFSYLAVDKGELYFLEKPGKWSLPPIPFGKGEAGIKGNKGNLGDRGDQGDQGPKGLPFNNFLTGLYAKRSTYDSKPESFSYIARDSGKLYFRVSSVLGTWSLGYPFGKGDRGNAFTIDRYGPDKDRKNYDLEPIGYTYYSADLQKVFFRKSGGWSVGIPMTRLTGKSFEIDQKGTYAKIGLYATQPEAFTYHAEDEGKIYFKKLGGHLTGWTKGIDFLKRGKPFDIDSSGTFAQRPLYDSKEAGFVYYAEDRATVYFREGLPGNWSRAYFFGANRGRIDSAQLVVGNVLNLSEGRDITGDFTINDYAVTKLMPQRVEAKHLKNLRSPIVAGRDGLVSLWDTTSKKWQYVDAKSLHKYDLMEDWALYYDAINDRVGRGTKTPSVSFDVAEDIATEDLVVRETLKVKEGASTFNTNQGDNDFLVKSGTNAGMLFVHAGLNRVGLGTVTPRALFDVNGVLSAKKVATGINVPQADLDVRGDALFNEGAMDYDFRVAGRLDPNLLFIDASTNRVGIGTATPLSKLDVRGAVVFNENSGGTNDFRVEGDNEANLLFTDASEDRVGIGTRTPQELLDVKGAATFNGGAGDHDFRVRGKTVDTVLYVDASTDRVGLGTGTPLANLDVRGTVVFNESELGGNTVRVVGAKRSPPDPTVNLLFMDVDNHRVGVGTSRPSAAMFEVTQDAVFNSEGGGNDFQVQGQTTPPRC